MPGRTATREHGIGTYQYTAGDQTWRWSDGVYAIHGFHRGDVVPTTERLLAHVHSADRRQAAQLLATCLRDGQLFSFLYRLIDVTGRPRWVLLTGEGSFAAARQVTGLHGYLIEMTEPDSQAQVKGMPSSLRRAIASRAKIEQAKGAVMLVYGLDADSAFALLSWQSQRSNIKLRELAARLLTAVGEDGAASGTLRQRLDEMVYNLPAGEARPAC
jgi:ANTAR domain/PAS fold